MVLIRAGAAADPAQDAPVLEGGRSLFTEGTELGVVTFRPCGASRAARPDPRAPCVARSRLSAPGAHWPTGDLATLIGLLDPDATAIIDGGGIVSAAIEPLHGAATVAEFFLGVDERQPDLVLSEELVNGQLGLVATGGGAIQAVIRPSHRDGTINRWSGTPTS